MLENLNIEIWDMINIVTGSIDWIVFFLMVDAVGNKKVYNIKHIYKERRKFKLKLVELSKEERKNIYNKHMLNDFHKSEVVRGTHCAAACQQRKTPPPGL